MSRGSVRPAVHPCSQTRRAPLTGDGVGRTGRTVPLHEAKQERRVMGPERIQEVGAPGGPLWPRPVLQALHWSCPTAGPEQLPLPSRSPALPEPSPSGVPLVGLCRGREPEAPGGPILQGPGKVARPSAGSQSRTQLSNTTATSKAPGLLCPARWQRRCLVGTRHPLGGQPPLPSTGPWWAGTGARTPHHTISDTPWESFLHSLDVGP